MSVEQNIENVNKITFYFVPAGGKNNSLYLDSVNF
jgi:hypothetical protein